MPIKVICACGKKFAVKDEFSGKKVKCPACQKVLNLSKATAEKLSPKDQRDFEESANNVSGHGPDQALEQFVGMVSSGADGSATSKNKSTGDDATRLNKKARPEPYDPCASQLRSVRASKVREGISCYFFGFLVIFFAGCWAAYAPTLYQGDLPKLMRVLRGVSFVGLIAEAIMTVGFGLCLTAPSKIRGRDSLLVTVIGGALVLLIESMTLWNPLYSLRIGPWLPQFVLLTTHAAFFLFLRWLGDDLGRSEIVSRATRVLVLLGIGAVIWLGVFRAQQPVPFMVMRNPILLVLLFGVGIVALIGLFSVIRLLSRFREILRTDERDFANSKAAREHGSADGDSKWLSRPDVLKLAIGGGLASLSLWGWMALHKPAPNPFQILASVPGGPPVVTIPGKRTLTLAGHKGMISNVAFSPDWSRLATASWDKTIIIWDAATAKELRTLTSHTERVSRVVFSPDGKWLASASADKSVKLWDAVSGKELRTMSGHTGVVHNVAFSPDGKRLASVSDDKTVKIWDATTGQELLTLNGHAEAITSVVFSPDGQRLATAGGLAPTEIKIWKTTSGQELLTLKGHATLISSMAFRPDGKQLATASYDMTLKLWDTTSGQETHSLIGHTGAVMGMAYRPDGKRLASSAVSMMVKEWDSENGQLCRTFLSTSAKDLAFSPDGKRLSAANGFGQVEIFDNPPDQPAPSHNGHTGAVTNVAFSPDGQRIASSSWDQTVKVWNATTGQVTHTFKGHDGPVGRVAFSQDGTSLLSATQQVFRTGTVKQWDANSGHETRTLEIPATSIVAMSEDGTRIASPNLALITSIPAGKELTLKVWDSTSGQELHALKGHSGPILSIALSRDGQWMASAGGTFQKPGEIKVWDVSSGQETRHWGTPTSGSTRVAISPDGKRLAVSNPDRTVKVWDTSNGQELVTFKGHEYQASSMAFSPDGKWLASGSGILPSLPGEMKLWDAVTGKEKVTLRGHKYGISSLTFSPDGKRLASASNDETVKVWDTTTGRELLRLGVPAQ